MTLIKYGMEKENLKCLNISRIHCNVNDLKLQVSESRKNYHTTVKVKYLYRFLKSHCCVSTTITDISYLLRSFKVQ